MGDIPQLLTLALTAKAPKVIDADAIAQVGDPERLRGQDAILTPHEGEFQRLFGDLAGTKAERALEAARRSGAIIVYKGPDTLVASPGRPARLRASGPGMAGQRRDRRRARGHDRGDAGARACRRSKRPAPAVWLHGRAAEIAGPNMIADDLAAAIPEALALL